MLQNGSRIIQTVFWTHFSKLGHAVKMDLQVDSSNVFHPESIDMDEKLYNNPIYINK
jgi:hypothetical protein